ncbi:hypothetical protein [Mycolicibacterium nivoides]|uniref:Uncharacterized protein n=1 Tax=Mycolicibacterium nivoides TaxID=2487344 RepID=A0ABW9LKJ4_9MYCO
MTDDLEVEISEMIASAMDRPGTRTKTENLTVALETWISTTST